MGSKQNKRKGIFALVAALWWLAKVLTALVNAVKDQAKDRGFSDDAVDERMLALGKSEGAETIRQMASLILGKAEAIAATVKSFLLSLIGTTSAITTGGRFVVKNHFKVDTSNSAEVKISYLGENFKNMFLNLVESGSVSMSLSYHTLLRNSVDGPILKELGGEDQAVATLAVLWELLKAQWDGRSGALLTNSYDNIFYIKDVTGEIRAVGVFWNGDGWSVNASSVTNPCEWNAGLQVFSRNS